ncbi:hypothetical protein LUZ60_012711 [Juncus effusus]|nr:hypothetical protein LUZ60_012711 [Juncus effusus]
MLASMDPVEKARCYGDYLQKLEDERKKIQVFQRELPLCLQLVSQTIENVRSQIESMASEEETVSDGPVLEEFIPLKPSLSSTSDEDQSAHEVKKDVNLVERSEMKTDWMQSVQLWNQAPDPSPPPMEAPYKPVALNARKLCGAFQPFEKQNQHKPTSPSSSPPSPSALPASSTGVTASSTSCEEKKREKETEKEREEQAQSTQRKSRRCWSPELHRRFLHALQQLGGSQVATPKQIRELMKVDGLTNDEVKSHLQKYRLHTRRPNSVQSNNTNNNNPQSGPQFVVVGGIWVPPSDYPSTITTGTTTTTVPSSGEKIIRPSKIYTPVASVPHKQNYDNNRLTEAGNNNDNKSAFASPSTSSSSQTTTASPQF